VGVIEVDGTQQIAMYDAARESSTFGLFTLKVSLLCEDPFTISAHDLFSWALITTYAST